MALLRKNAFAAAVLVGAGLFWSGFGVSVPSEAEASRLALPAGAVASVMDVNAGHLVADISLEESMVDDASSKYHRHRPPPTRHHRRRPPPSPWYGFGPPPPWYWYGPPPRHGHRPPPRYR